MYSWFWFKKKSQNIYFFNLLENADLYFFHIVCVRTTASDSLLSHWSVAMSNHECFDLSSHILFPAALASAEVFAIPRKKTW